MNTSDLRQGRLILLLFAVAFAAGGAVQAVRTIPDPNLFSSATGTIITLGVTGLVMALVLQRRPSWLTRRRPPD